MLLENEWNAPGRLEARIRHQVTTEARTMNNLLPRPVGRCGRTRGQRPALHLVWWWGLSSPTPLDRKGNSKTQPDCMGTITSARWQEDVVMFSSSAQEQMSACGADPLPDQTGPAQHMGFRKKLVFQERGWGVGATSPFFLLRALMIISDSSSPQTNKDNSSPVSTLM